MTTPKTLKDIQATVDDHDITDCCETLVRRLREEAKKKIKDLDLDYRTLHQGLDLSKGPNNAREYFEKETHAIIKLRNWLKYFNSFMEKDLK